MDVVHHNSTLKLQHQKISSTSYGELIEYNGSSSSSSFRPLKLQRESAINEDQTANMESRRAAIIASLRKFQQESESSERDFVKSIKNSFEDLCVVIMVFVTSRE
ncbi:Uncharacterized protein Fot_22095 [Forsythia ovata]|uniref:Uncharacterized protein n=1 Tax=Forsythia ovata TaxID=205694 RepID=A0ABD1UWS0_9LAMI